MALACVPELLWLMVMMEPVCSIFFKCQALC